MLAVGHLAISDNNQNLRERPAVRSLALYSQGGRASDGGGLRADGGHLAMAKKTSKRSNSELLPASLREGGAA